MDPTRLLPLQFFLSLLAWSIVGFWLLAPWLGRRRRDEALAILLVPQTFRHLGVTLLAPGVAAPSLPPDFARGVASGDLATVALALLALVALRLGWRASLGLAWAANLFGVADALINCVQGIRLGAAPHLGAQWYVVAFIVPLILVAHALSFGVLAGRIRTREKARG